VEQDKNLIALTKDLLTMVERLERRVETLEAQQRFFSQPPMVVQNMTVYRLDTEKIQFNLDEISVQELNGTLNIGINRNKIAEKTEESTPTVFSLDSDSPRCFPQIKT
jgi:hypothetical protein